MFYFIFVYGSVKRAFYVVQFRVTNNVSVIELTQEVTKKLKIGKKSQKCKTKLVTLPYSAKTLLLRASSLKLFFVLISNPL